MLKGSTDINRWYLKNSRLMNALDSLAEDYGVSFSQYNILSNIDHEFCSTPTQIAQRIQTSKASVSRSLKVLGNKNLIQKVYGHTDDQRKTEIIVTSEGQEIIEKISEKLNSFDRIAE